MGERGATGSTARWPGRSMWLGSGGRCSWCASSRLGPSGSKISWRGCLASEPTSLRTGSRRLRGRIVRRATLPPPAGSNVYELTELGVARAGDRGPLAVGARLLDAPREEEDLRAGWAAVAMRSALGRGSRAAVLLPTSSVSTARRSTCGLETARKGESGGQTRLGPGSRPGRHRRRRDLPRGGLRKA